MPSRTRFTPAGLLALALALTAAPHGAGADTNLATQAEAVLKHYCYRCHGRAGVAKGGMNFILDRDRLVARKKVLPGNAAESPLYQRVADGEMPPETVKVRPGKDELAALRKWSDAGAPGFAAAPDRRPVLSEADVSRLVLADLNGVEPRQRRFLRYFSFAHLVAAGAPESEVQSARLALAKL